MYRIGIGAALIMLLVPLFLVAVVIKFFVDRSRASQRLAELKPAGRLSFSGYEQIIAAAIAGHGVALGRSPLLKDALEAGELVAPFTRSADPSRAYYAIVSSHAQGRPEVAEFVAWLKREADGAETSEAPRKKRA